MDRIVDIQMQGLAKRLEARDIDLSWTDAAKQGLAVEGYDPLYGARPLKRVIQRVVQDQLARQLLTLETRRGHLFVVGSVAER